MAGMSPLCLRCAGGEEAITHDYPRQFSVPRGTLHSASARYILALLADRLQRCNGSRAAIELAGHRAIYELTLAHSHSCTVSARGRILYDFSGNSCEGYALLFRQVSELDNGEGKTTLSDLRSTSWEEGTAKRCFQIAELSQ